MVFEIVGKVALVTGGASGIGLNIARELLRQSVKGVAIADVNEITGEAALAEIEKEFGVNKALFVKTDVTNKENFECAFKQTVEKFGYVDILINNAGIMNDAIWEKEIDINLKGMINGVVLGLETHLRNHNQSDEAVILNTCSIAGVVGQPLCPVYGATKFGVLGLTKCWGSPFHYQRTKVRVVAVCPGITDTQIFESTSLILPEYENGWPCKIDSFAENGQKPEHVAKEAARIIKFAENGSAWIVEDGESAYEFIMPERESFKENTLKEHH